MLHSEQVMVLLPLLHNEHYTSQFWGISEASSSNLTKRRNSSTEKDLSSHLIGRIIDCCGSI